MNQYIQPGWVQRLTLLSFLVCLLSGTRLGFGSPQKLWEIGCNDSSGREFALFGKPREFAARYPSTFTFEVGKAPASQWPFIHPGPSDSWAHSTSHTLLIRFQLSQVPRGRCDFAFHTVSADWAPQLMRIEINGTSTTMELPGGFGESAIKNERDGLPRSFHLAFHPTLLKSGTNEIALTITSGKWLLYDDLSLETDPQLPPDLLAEAHIEQTPFLQKDGGEVEQMVRLWVRNLERDTTVVATTQCGDVVLSRALALAFGLNQVLLPVRAVNVPTSLTVSLSGESPLTLQDTALPQKKWKLFIVPSVHLDIGYNMPPEAAMKLSGTNLDTALGLLASNPLIKWNAEAAWEIEEYLESRPTALRNELLKRIKERRLGVDGAYLNTLTGLLTDEAMNRLFGCAGKLRRNSAINISSAVLTDVPSATWGLPSALASSGIRYFAQGCNPAHGMDPFAAGVQAPFYWEGPDGKRVLTLLTRQYAQSAWLATSPDLPHLESAVRETLRPYEQGYPYDAIYVYGALMDNNKLDSRYGSLLAQWNATWLYPQLQVATSEEFFRYLEQHYAKDLPVRRGDFGAYWEDGAASSARETAEYLNASRRICAAETLWSLARLAGTRTQTPQNLFDRAWKSLLFYAEHTWGAWESVSKPDGVAARQWWASKAQYAHQSTTLSRELLETGLDSYLKAVPAANGEIVIVNVLSWTRSGCVRLPEPLARGNVIEDEKGNQVATQTVNGETQIWAAEIPGFGHRKYRIRPGSRLSPAPSQASAAIESPYYRIRLNSERGVLSILEKESGEELIQPDSPYGFAQLLYVEGGDDSAVIGDRPRALPDVVIAGKDKLSPLTSSTLVVNPAQVNKVTQSASGPLFSEALIHSSTPQLTSITTRLRLYQKEKRMTLDVEITSKPIVYRKEAVYVAFPFSGEGLQARLGMANTVAAPTKDFMPGACHEWYCVQNYVALDGPNVRTVVWTSPDAPLVTLRNIVRGARPSAPSLTSSTLLSYAMNNYWFTNYCAGQDGDMTFHYELTSAKSGMSDTSCERFAKEAQVGLLAGVSKGRGGPAKESVNLEGEGVIALTLKQAEDKEGLILRLHNTRSLPTTATLRVPHHTVRQAWLCSLTEENISSLAVQKGAIRVSLRGRETVTVRLGSR